MADPEGDFRTRWGWKVTISELSGDDPIKEEYWWGCMYVHVLNELSFRKERNHVKSTRRG